MTHGIVQHQTTGVTPRLLSPQIWADCPIGAITVGARDGVYFFDDFIASYELAAGSSLTKLGVYECIADTGASLTGEDDTTATNDSGMWGAQEFVAGTTGDADLVVQLGGGGAFTISDTAGDDKKLWFEARFKISTITNDISSCFIGLGEPNRAANAGVFTTTQGATADSAFADVAFIGFWRPDADGDGLSFMYGANGQTASELIADIHTLVADTYVKVGFKYDGGAPTAKRIKVYINGVENSTYVTGTLIAAAAFPDAEVMSPVAACQNDDGSTASTMTLDWWACAQASD
jgi:hypothetical protein